MENRLSRKLAKGLKELDKNQELIEDEREACAKLANSYRAGIINEEIYGEYARVAGSEIAKAIRNRKIVTKAE